MNDSREHRHKRARPSNDDDERKDDVRRRRSRSPRRHRSHARDRDGPPEVPLPFRASHLRKSDFVTFRATFADYLDLQKQLDIDELTEDEVKGRWKSFLGKWNRGELAEGWYDPETKKKADERRSAGRSETWESHASGETGLPRRRGSGNRSEEDEEEEDEGYGPALPSSHRSKTGPSVPRMQDLEHRRELAMEDRDARRADLRFERNQDRRAQKERLEELVPRADPGSRERQLEKKRDFAVVNREFKDAKDSGDQEVGDNELMGDDGIDSYKAKARVMERKKNEREIRKEEMLRARAAEREERIAEHRKKEEKTMDMLKGLAQQRFGGGAGRI